jgi:hypothetical protein
MQQNTPEDPKARTDSPRFSIDDFECELPPEVRTELLQPKRPKMLGRQVKGRYGPRAIVLAVLVLLLAAGIVVALLGAILTGLHDKPATQPSTPVQAPSVQPTPAATPVATPPPVGIAPTPSPRAALVKLPAPRAMLVGEPIPAAAQLFPSGRTPMWRQTGEREWTIWQPGNLDYIYIVDAQCTVSRANAIGRQVCDFAPRAEPVTP